MPLLAYSATMSLRSCFPQLVRLLCHLGHLLVAAHVEGVELVLGEVGELVDCHLPAGAGPVVLLDPAEGQVKYA